MRTAMDGATVARLRLSLLRLARRLRQQADSRVTLAQLSALATVERWGPMRLGDLAARERISKSSLTRTVAGLEGAEYVDCRPDPDDGRCTQVALAEAGRRLLAASRERADAYLAERVADLSAEDQAVLAAAVPVMERLLEASP